MNREEFNVLVLKLSKKLYVYAYRILKHQEEAEDAVQEIFIRLWKMGVKLDEYDSIEALALTMIKNYSIDQLRKHKNFNYEYINSVSSNYETESSPHEQMERNETYNILTGIIRELPDLYRQIIRLREIEGLTYEEISEITSQKINNLRVILSRGRRIIRDEYKKYLYEQRGTGKTSGKVL